MAPRCARHVELAVDEIDGNDRIGAREVGKLHDVEPNAADAEHHDRFPDLDLGVVVDHAGRGGYRAAQQRRIAEIVVRLDHGHAIFGNHRIFVERRHPARVELFAMPLIGRRLALDALARPPVQHDGVAGLHGRYTGADLDHLRRRLMAKQMRQELVRSLGGRDLVDLGAADRAVEHFDQTPGRPRASPASVISSTTSGSRDCVRIAAFAVLTCIRDAYSK